MRVSYDQGSQQIILYHPQQVGPEDLDSLPVYSSSKISQPEFAETYPDLDVRSFCNQLSRSVNLLYFCGHTYSQGRRGADEIGILNPNRVSDANEDGLGATTVSPSKICMEAQNKAYC